MIRPGKMIKEVIGQFFKKAATTQYPFVKTKTAASLRGAILFHADKCIGCKLCMKDCPSGAITITKVGDKQFECDIDLAKCIFCGQCVDSCLKKALEVTNEFELASLERSKLKIHFRGEPKQPLPGTENKTT